MKLKSAITRLRIAGACFAGILFILFLFAFKAAHTLSDDVWVRLGLNKEQGFENVKSSFFNGNLYYYGARNIRNIATGDRTAVANDLLTAAKEYINSEAFKKEYELQRQRTKPQEEMKAVRTKEEIRKDEIAKAEKGIKETEEIIKKNPSMANDMKGVIDMYKQTLADYKDPENAMIDYFYQNEKILYENKIKDYNKDLAKWKTTFPEDFRQLIKTRLQKFLDLSGTVDFNAQLRDVFGKQKFVNPTYEGKPAEWKQIFRAGKEVTDAARKFAHQWLTELSK
jgi:hypothetical protein